MDKKDLKFVFWGTGPLAESTIYSMYKNGILPKYIITKPDSKVGRKQEIISPIIKTWGESKNIKVLQPISLKKEEIENNGLKEILQDQDIDFYLVASYGKILPNYFFEDIKNREGKNIPIINVHPSDLPDLRGPSPVQYALMRGDENITVTIMEMDKMMDHGNVIIKNKFFIDKKDTLDNVLRKAGNIAGDMIMGVIDLYLSGNINTKEQNHDLATFTKFIEKETGDITSIIIKDALINLNIDNKDLLEIKNRWRGLHPWPGLYFIVKDKNQEDKRIKITQINIDGNNLENTIEKIIPEGKKEISFVEYLKNNP